jgi:hypothetical protein
MTLKLSIASSRKIGEPHYGSRGAVVGLEMEVDTTLVDCPRQLRLKIAKLFRLAKQAVDRELEGRGCAGGQQVEQAGNAPVSDRPATSRQLRALHAIADRRQIDLQAEVQARLGIARPEELSLEEASELIATLGAVRSRRVALEAQVQLPSAGAS